MQKVYLKTPKKEKRTILDAEENARNATARATELEAEIQQIKTKLDDALREKQQYAEQATQKLAACSTAVQISPNKTDTVDEENTVTVIESSYVADHKERNITIGVENTVEPIIDSKFYTDNIATSRGQSVHRIDYIVGNLTHFIQYSWLQSLGQSFEMQDLDQAFLNLPEWVICTTIVLVLQNWVPLL